MGTPIGMAMAMVMVILTVIGKHIMMRILRASA